MQLGIMGSGVAVVVLLQQFERICYRQVYEGGIVPSGAVPPGSFLEPYAAGWTWDAEVSTGAIAAN